VAGPGQYNARSDFERTLFLKGVSEKGTFFINDNGHVNQRVQNYAHEGRKSSVIQAPNKAGINEISPGPGSYKPTPSLFEKGAKVGGPILGAPSKLSPRSQNRGSNSHILAKQTS